MLGVLTVADRVAHRRSSSFGWIRSILCFTRTYGYRPGRSAHDAIAVTKRRCWEFDWVVELDIKGLFDNIDQFTPDAGSEEADCQTPWVLLYGTLAQSAVADHGW